MNNSGYSIKLLPHQIEGVKFLLQNRGGLVGDDPGSGKTIQFLEFANQLMHEGGELQTNRRIIMVVPAGIVDKTIIDIEQYYGFTPCRYDGVAKTIYPNWVMVVSYETLRVRDKTGYPNARLLKKITQDKELILCFDEAHNFADQESDTWKSCAMLPAIARVVMSGTLMWNKVESIYPVIKMYDRTLDEQWFFNNFTVRKLRRISRFKSVWDYVGYKNVEELNRYLGSILIRRKKEAWASQLPKKEVRYVPYQMTDALYDQVLNVQTISDDSPMVKVGKLLAAASGLCRDTDRFIPGAKFDMLYELLTYTTGKRIVFFKYLETLQHIKKLLTERGFNCYEWTGGNRNARHKQRVLWGQSTDGVLLGTYASAGVGHNFVEGTTAIAYELDMVPAILEQAEDRIHRIGQLNSVTIIYLYGINTVEESLLVLLRKKKKLSTAVIDGVTESEARDICKLRFKLEC